MLSTVHGARLELKFWEITVGGVETPEAIIVMLLPLHTLAVEGVKTGVIGILLTVTVVVAEQLPTV